MNLAEPQMLWLLLLVIPPLVFFLWWAWRKRQQLVAQFISARLLGTLKVGVSPSRQKFRMGLLVAAVVFLILSLARPRWGYTWEEAKQRGLDIIIAIDTSNSMLAEDMPPNRLARAKLAALDLMRKAKTDRLGVIAFAGSAFLQCPLTLDDGAFAQSVNSLDTKTISDGGTAIGEAIDEARKAFKDEPNNHKVLVLFTDGEDHDSNALPAAEEAAKEGVRIFTVGIGSPEGELLRIRGDDGRMDFIRDEDGNPVKSRLNDTLLQDIAREAGGFYLHLSGNKTMDTLYEQGLAPLPKSTNSSKLLRHYRERFQWPLSMAIILLILEMFLPDRKRRRSKEAAAPATLAAASQVAIAALLLAVPMSLHAGPSRALHEYDSGDYQDALKDYDQLLANGKDDPRLHFNAGAAAYQSKQFAEATNQFYRALNSPDLQLQQRAYYNLGNTYFRLGQQGGAMSGAQAASPSAINPALGSAMDPDAKIKTWEEAVRQYDNAIKLNTNDTDARFNKSFVEKRIEELKKQQQKQQQSKDDKQQKQDKQNKQDQSQNNSQQNQDKNSQQDKQDKNSQQQQDKNSQAQKNDQQKSDQNQQSQQNQQDQQKSQAQQQQQKQDQAQKQDQNGENQSSGQQDEKSKEEEARREAAMMAAGQMTPQQAKQLLDAEKGKEQVLNLAPPDKGVSHSPSYKNW